MFRNCSKVHINTLLFDRPLHIISRAHAQMLFPHIQSLREDYELIANSKDPYARNQLITDLQNKTLLFTVPGSFNNLNSLFESIRYRSLLHDIARFSRAVATFAYVGRQLQTSSQGKKLTWPKTEWWTKKNKMQVEEAREKFKKKQQKAVLEASEWAKNQFQFLVFADHNKSDSDNTSSNSNNNSNNNANNSNNNNNDKSIKSPTKSNANSNNNSSSNNEENIIGPNNFLANANFEMLSKDIMLLFRKLQDKAVASLNDLIKQFIVKLHNPVRPGTPKKDDNSNDASKSKNNNSSSDNMKVDLDDPIYQALINRGKLLENRFGFLRNIQIANQFSTAVAEKMDIGPLLRMKAMLDENEGWSDANAVMQEQKEYQEAEKDFCEIVYKKFEGITTYLVNHISNKLIETITDLQTFVEMIKDTEVAPEKISEIVVTLEDIVKRHKLALRGLEGKPDARLERLTSPKDPASVPAKFKLEEVLDSAPRKLDSVPKRKSTRGKNLHMDTRYAVVV